MIKLNPKLNPFDASVPIWEHGQFGGRTRPINRKALYYAMKDFVEVLEKHNIKYCLSHGTMLGIYRDGDFIAWDDDVDIALLDFENQRQYFIEKCRPEIISKGFYMPPFGNPNKPVKATGPDANMPYYDSVGIRNGEKIECWWFEKKIHGNQSFYIYDEPRSKWDLKHPAKFYDELQDFEWRDKKWKIPNHIEEYLVLMYGDKWNKPDKNRKYTNQSFDSKGNLIIKH